MRMWRTWPARTRVAALAGVGVLAVGVAVVGLTHRAPPPVPVVHGPSSLYSSTAKEGRDTAIARPKPMVQASASPFPAVTHPAARRKPHTTTAVAQPQVAAPTVATQAPADFGVVSPLAARFPALAHQALSADPGAGTEAQYFARLGNLLDGTPLPPGTQIPAVADHLAQAQVDLYRDDLAGAAAQVRQISGPAAGVLRGWTDQLEAQLSDSHAHSAAKKRLVQNVSQQAWPNVMPTEIPPFARQSTGPAG